MTESAQEGFPKKDPNIERKNDQAIRFWVEAFPNYDMEYSERAARELSGKFKKWRSTVEERKQPPVIIDLGYAISYATRMAEANEYRSMNPESAARERKFWQVRQQIGEKAIELRAQKAPRRK